MSWKKVKLGELIDNFSVRAKDIGGAQGLTFFGVSNELGITKTKYAAEDKAENYKIIEQYCFAYNPYRINVGSIGMVTDNIRGLISPAYVVFKTKPNSIKAELLLRFLKSSEGLRQIRLHARGTVRQALRFEDLCNIELSLPNFNEQEVLLKRLISVESKNNLLNTELLHQLDLLKKLRQTLLQEAMQGKLVEQNPEEGSAMQLLKKIKKEKEKLIIQKKLKKEKELEAVKKEEVPFDIPENWVWCRLYEICLKITDGTHHSPPNYESGDFMYVTAKNIKDNGIEFDNISYVSKNIHDEIFARCNPEKGDILYIKDGATTGVVTINNLEEPFSMLSSVALLKPSSFIDNKFLMYVLRSPFYYQATRKDMSGVAITRVTLEKIQKAIVPLPPIQEQKRIVEKVELIMNLCVKIEKNISQSKTESKKLIQVLLNETLGIKSIKYRESENSFKQEIRKFQTVGNTYERINMKIIEILQANNKPISAAVVWNSSEYNKDIEAFYAELKRLIDIEKLVLEEKQGNESFLKLATNEN